MALAHDRARVIAMAGTLSSSAGSAARKALRSAGATPADVAALRARAAVVARLSHTGPFTSIALAANAVSARGRRALCALLRSRARGRAPARLPRPRGAAALARGPGQGRAGGRRPPGRDLEAAAAAVVGHGGGTVAAAYGRHVAAMHRLAQAPGGAFRSEAVNGLNIVDELESVFLR